MNIYPNPVTDAVNVEFTLQRNRQVKLQLYDELGKLVKRVKKDNYKIGTNKIQLEIGSLKSGIYFISLTFEGEVYTKQIVKN